MDVQWKYKRGQGVVYVMCSYGIPVWGRGLHQELWYVVDGNVISVLAMVKSLLLVKIVVVQLVEALHLAMV